MQTDKTDKSIWMVLLAATAASLCCITPVLGILAGIGGIASAFSWLEPARSYLVALTVLILSFAWYKKLKPAKAATVDCDCEIDAKPSFWHTKAFLGIISVAVALRLTFPTYSGIFFRSTQSVEIIAEKENIAMATLHIQGMTCSGCEQSVNKALRDKAGVIESNASHQRGIARVKYDKSRTDISDFRDAVEQKVGYTLTGIYYESP